MGTKPARATRLPIPGRGDVLVRVEACGVCHSGSLTIVGHVPGIEFPRVPGHEIAGRIEAVGDDTFPWEVGQRVGVGWFGGNCGYCDPCRRTDKVQARSLGAHHYIDSTGTDVAEVLQALGAAADPMQIPPFALTPGSTSSSARLYAPRAHDRYHTEPIC